MIDLLKDRHIGDIIIESFLNFYYTKHRFRIAVDHTICEKCNENISDLSCALYTTFLFLPAF